MAFDPNRQTGGFPPKPGGQQGFYPQQQGAGQTPGTGNPGFATPGNAHAVPGTSFYKGPQNRTLAPGTFPGMAAGGGKEGVLSGAGYQEDFYKQHGQDLMSGSSASERLFDQGIAASNPFYDYAQQQTIKAINDQSAARGSYNSSYTMRNIGNAVADLRGQQAHGLTQLAGQSDAARRGRYADTSAMAGAAQNQTQNRVGQATGATGDLAQNRANATQGFYGAATQGMSQAEMAAIELELKKAGMSAAEMQQFWNTFGQLGGAAIKAAG